MTHVPPERRNVGLVFQSYALFDNMSVLANVAFGPKMQGVEKAERRDRATELWSYSTSPNSPTERPRPSRAGNNSGSAWRVRTRSPAGRSSIASCGSLLSDDRERSPEPIRRWRHRPSLRAMCGHLMV
ncbi:ABC-type spermidine/putrescine transport system, ATPase component (plasmid) [Halomicrobium sp. LC1Hm]|nr:ABC-type spermidine/putrescine transport system, ATPase component [Halomicrobium sp. LC1Hm]